MTKKPWDFKRSASRPRNIAAAIPRGIEKWCDDDRPRGPFASREEFHVNTHRVRRDLRRDCMKALPRDRHSFPCHCT
jgi:hypothetical protein